MRFSEKYNSTIQQKPETDGTSSFEHGEVQNLQRATSGDEQNFRRLFGVAGTFRTLSYLRTLHLLLLPEVPKPRGSVSSG